MATTRGRTAARRTAAARCSRLAQRRRSGVAARTPKSTSRGIATAERVAVAAAVRQPGTNASDAPTTTPAAATDSTAVATSRRVHFSGDVRPRNGRPKGPTPTAAAVASPAGATLAAAPTSPNTAATASTRLGPIDHHRRAKPTTAPLRYRSRWATRNHLAPAARAATTEAANSTT